MKIALASDHGGYTLKEVIKLHLVKAGYEITDLGTDNAESGVDYPNYGLSCAKEVASGKADKGIVFCGTGQGIGISCNKVEGIRCAILGDSYSAKMAAKHNNCNMISLGARVTGPDLAVEIVDSFLNSAFEGGRHQRRVDLIMDIEQAR